MEKWTPKQWEEVEVSNDGKYWVTKVFYQSAKVYMCYDKEWGILRNRNYIRKVPPQDTLEKCWDELVSLEYSESFDTELRDIIKRMWNFINNK